MCRTKCLLNKPQQESISATLACRPTIKRRIWPDSPRVCARPDASLREAGCEEVIEDIGSGLNCSKPGLRSLLRQLLDGRVKKLSVVHEDRLLRFGVGLIRQICRRMRTEVDVLENRAEKTFEEELARDVITLMTVFCARLYGRRSHRNKQSVKVPACATKMADRHEAMGRDVDFLKSMQFTSENKTYLIRSFLLECPPSQQPCSGQKKSSRSAAFRAVFHATFHLHFSHHQVIIAQQKSVFFKAKYTIR